MGVSSALDSSLKVAAYIPVDILSINPAYFSTSLGQAGIQDDYICRAYVSILETDNVAWLEILPRNVFLLEFVDSDLGM